MATVATWGHRFGANADFRLGFDCPRYVANTCIGFRQYLQVWFLIPPGAHSLSDIRFRQLSDQRPDVVLPTPCG